MSRHHQGIKNDPRWKAARLECLERDGYACVRCGETEGLEADHIIRLSEAPELGLEVDNLQTLCRPCHQEKEREAAGAEVRNTWANPRYPEIESLVFREAG